MTRSARPAASPGCPESVARLDLSRHGLLEASAGTGKTYAIEHLVLRLLLESDGWELPRILVLTFTEKAAGELKEKIRARLAWRIAQGGLSAGALARLRDAHLGFDRASIHTIHGFCQRVLRDYAFENNALFRMEVVTDNREVLGRALKEEMRSTWLLDAGEGEEGLRAFRATAAALGLGARSKWDEKLLRIAESFNPARGDALLPEFDPARAEACEDAVLAAVAAIRARFPDLRAGAEADHPFARRYRAVRFANATLKRKAPLLLESALALAAACDPASPRAERLARCRAFLDGITLNAAKAGFACLRPAPEECDTLPWPELDALIGALDALRKGLRDREKEEGARAFADQRRVILGLRARAQAYKRSQGLLGFDDMIEGVHAALRNRPDFVRALRQEYRCCLVDEFQDTDPLQWDIFRRIFLDAGGTHPLFLIGDPKQAIYRFRGGDIHTYMDARAALQALSAGGRAQGISLDTNYRSHRDMVAACNALFAHPGWFHALEADPGAEAWKLPATPDPLGYVPVKHGGLPVQDCEDRTGRPGPVVFRDFSDESGKAGVERKVLSWLTAEIAALMAAPERLMIPEKGTGRLRPLEYGDICVLVKTNREKARMEKALFREGIPFQVDRRAGLYRGDAAGQYLALLKALEDPRDPGRQALALLTRFFRAPGDPPPAARPGDPHPWFDEWVRLAERRQWQKLFRSLLFRTGLLHRESLEPDGDRRIMDFLHIGQNLVLEALAGGLSLPALVQRLQDLRLDSGEEDDLHREESEGGKVALMTMHGSKGLEFPVVLLAAFTGPPRAAWLKYRQGTRTVFNLDAKDPEALAAYAEEAEGEDRRLFYVAFTRARYKMYAPLLPPGYARSQSGPLGGFVADALRAAAAAHPRLFHRVQEVAAEEPAAVPDAAAGPAWDAGAARGGRPAADFFADLPAGDPLAGAEGGFSSRRRRLNSYSHLVRRGAGSSAGSAPSSASTVSAEGLEGRFEKDEVAGDGPAEEAIDAPPAAAAPGNALPRGKEIGNMFHEILEELDFALAARAPSPEDLLEDRTAADLIGTRMLEHRLPETHRGDVARVLWHALNARIPDAARPGESFRLGDVPGRRHEMEFLFPYPPGGDGGYLWGYIDLVFRRDGRYYLLDWKSNWLEEYGPASLERSIRESRYDLQYMLYAMALDRWLAGVLPDYRFGRDFGGIYYVYLRGMRAVTLPPEGGEDGEGEEGAAPGVFALRPTEEQIRQAFPEAVEKAMGPGGTGDSPGEALRLAGRMPGTGRTASATAREGAR